MINTPRLLAERVAKLSSVIQIMHFAPTLGWLVGWWMAFSHQQDIRIIFALSLPSSSFVFPLPYISPSSEQRDKSSLLFVALALRKGRDNTPANSDLLPLVVVVVMAKPGRHNLGNDLIKKSLPPRSEPPEHAWNGATVVLFCRFCRVSGVVLTGQTIQDGEQAVLW